MELLPHLCVMRGDKMEVQIVRRFLISAAIVALVGGGSLAAAQDRDRHGGPDNAPQAGGRDENHAGGPAPAPHTSPAPNAGAAMSAPREHHDAPAMRAAPTAQPNPVQNNAPRNENVMRAAPTAQPNAVQNNAPRNDNVMRARGPGNAPNNAIGGNTGGPNLNRPNNGPNNAMRGNNGPRRDFSSARNFHQNFNAQRHFHAPVYRRPPGFYSHRWGWGEFLPAPFWARDYWLIDFTDYDLPPPPFGAIWVRVGDDALLIDQDSGEIIAVEYGIFY
jgi:Ni/Co efflux regulator RcnB